MEKMNGGDDGRQGGQPEEDVVYVPVPKGRPWLLFVFKAPQSAVADMASSPDIEAAQMHAVAGYLGSRADYLFKRKMDRADKSAILVPR